MRYNPKAGGVCVERRANLDNWSPLPAISMCSFPVRWHKLICVPEVCQIEQLGEGGCVSELQFGDSAAEGNSLWPEGLQGSLLLQWHFIVAGNQCLTLPVELHTWFCTPKVKERSVTLLATGVSLWLCSGLTYTLCQVFFSVCCMMASNPSCSLLNPLHCPEGWLKPSHCRHWMHFESRSNKRSYREGKCEFTGFQ